MYTELFECQHPILHRTRALHRIAEGGIAGLRDRSHTVQVFHRGAPPPQWGWSKEKKLLATLTSLDPLWSETSKGGMTSPGSAF